MIGRRGWLRPPALAAWAVLLALAVLTGVARAAPPPVADLKIVAGPAEPVRVALVVGNGAYQAGPKLANPVNDARGVAAALRSLGFEVIALENATQKDMQRGIAEFSRKLSPTTVSLFYYAGHGMQVGGRNYLIPVDAELSTEQIVRLETIDVDAVLEQMTAANSRVNLVILDACRTNPFETRFRGTGGGLASIDAPAGTLISYATAPGRVAADGDGDHGLYTTELLSALGTPGLKVEDVFKRVRVGVMAKTNGQQIPWESSSLTGDFYFRADGAATTPAPTAVPAPAAVADREALFWETIKSSTNPNDFKAYLDAYPTGTFAALARERAGSATAATAAPSAQRSVTAGPAPAAPAASTGPSLPDLGATMRRLFSPGAPAAPSNSQPASAAPTTRDAAGACRPGQHIYAFSDNSWSPGTARDLVEGGRRCAVSYDDAANGDAIVDMASVIPWAPDGPGTAVSACVDGAAVLVDADGDWYPARVEGSAGRQCVVVYQGGDDDGLHATVDLTNLRTLGR